jgi:biopolymer transport protein ExbB
MMPGISQEWAPVLAQAATPVADKSLLQHLQSGGPIGYAIVLLSFVGLALVVAQLLRIRRQALAPDDAVAALDRLLRDNDIAGASRFCADPGNDSYVVRVLGSALTRCERSPFGLLELRTAMEEAGQAQTARLQRATDAIGLIAAVAPMLGLFGTVVGMVGAFDTIATTEGFAKPAQLAGSIAVALITTVLGLLVAIPMTAAHSYLRNRIDDVVEQVAQVAEDLAAHIEGAGGAPPGGAAPQGPSRPRGRTAAGSAAP